VLKNVFTPKRVGEVALKHRSRAKVSDELILAIFVPHPLARVGA
jgi:hypothetical protein